MPRRLWAIFRIPIVNSIFVPVVNLLLEICDTRLLRAHDLVFALITSTSTEFNIVIRTFHHSETILSAAILHATMVPATQTNGTETANDIGYDVERVKCTIIG